MLFPLERIYKMPSVAVGKAQISKILKLLNFNCEFLQANKIPKLNERLLLSESMDNWASICPPHPQSKNRYQTL